MRAIIHDWILARNICHYTGPWLHFMKTYKKNNPDNPVNRKYYETQFHNLNLSKKRPNKDTCQTGDRLNTLIQFSDDETTLKQELEEHYREADAAYNAKRRLWTFNFTVHDCDERQTHCFVWDESAGRGVNSQFLSLSSEPCIIHITMYSDTCRGQNKNSHMSAKCLVTPQL
ncbi:hypothetical protein PR048_017242 [Dryococelus australis]|uniref:Uncharacterized protein n=1 Tax=Dryococelus australis TaxID=614101 RepID=A0ABQ9H8Z0_9NEOP|nr:hypothetical protein PR048_017242 [Dryococelus australis]